MKVAELRDELGKHDVEALRALAEALYRMMPTKLREEKGTDEVVRHPLAAKGKPRPRRPTVPDPDDALLEARFFLEHARQQHYFAPNTFVRKKERAGWRFVAGRVYRNLLALQASEEDRKEAADLLVDLFRVLCRGEEVYLFPSTQPFEAMRVAKEDMLRAVLRAARANLPTDDSLDLLLQLVTTGTWFLERLRLAAAAVAEVPTPELRERLAERAAVAARRAEGNLTPRRGRGPGPPASPTPPSERQRLLAVVSALAHHANREPERALAAHRELLGRHADACLRDLAYVLPDLVGDDG